MIITIELIANMYLLLFVQYDHPVPVQPDREISTGRKRLIRSHSSAGFCFELSGNSN